MVTGSQVRHIGRVLISPKIMLEMLRLYGGVVMGVEISEDQTNPGIVFKIEHPDMPEISEGDVIPIVLPTYRQMECEHGLTVYDREPGPIT